MSIYQPILIMEYSFILIYLTAAWNGQTAVCKVLIKKGSDINAKNKNGHTALDWGKYSLNNWYH